MGLRGAPSWLICAACALTSCVADGVSLDAKRCDASHGCVVHGESCVDGVCRKAAEGEGEGEGEGGEGEGAGEGEGEGEGEGAGEGEGEGEGEGGEGEGEGAGFAARVNIAGPAHSGVDFPGAWSADAGSGGICNGSPLDVTGAINGTGDPELFDDQMFAGALACHVAGVPAGSYRVTLLFAEIFRGGAPCAGGSGVDRKFDIEIEGAVVEPSLDFIAVGGGCALPGGSGHAFTKSYDVDVDDGTLDVVMNATSGAAAINALEIEAR
jgi:hypothetical protein